MSLHSEVIEIGRILGEEDFRVSFHPDDEPLPGLSQFGLLQPPVLFPAEQAFQIVCGFRRVEQARAAGMVRVPALICTGWDRRQALMLGLMERLSHGSLNEVERARCFDAFLRAGWERRELSESLAPLLGVKISPLLLDQWKALLASPRLIQQGVGRGTMHVYTAFRLSRWKPHDLQIAGWFFSCRLGVNRQRELLDLMEDLKAAGIPAAGVLEPLEAIWRSTEPASVGEAWLAHLRRLRYPRLTEVQRRFDQSRARLKLPGQMRLNAPAYFEETRYSVSFPFGTRAELEQCARKLLEVSGTPELEEMLKLV